MCRTVLFSLTLLLLLAGGSLAADTIFTWTDAQGVRHFSNTKPPDDAEKVETIEGVRLTPGDDTQARQTYERMAKEAGEEADRYYQEQEQQRAQAAEARHQQQEAQDSERIAAERARLQQEIAALEGRALSPTFSAGMRENLIQQLQEKINQLPRAAVVPSKP